MKKLLRISLVLSILVIGVLATTSTVVADKPAGPHVGPPAFLCPIVGNDTAATHNGQGWFGVNAGWTFFPGNNQAGVHANPNSWNTLGPGASPGPGTGNSDWSPIWPWD
jgi:hypothetical protein